MINFFKKEQKNFISNTHLFKEDSECKKEKFVEVKACEIYRTRKHYKIVTLYQLEAGRFTSNKPVFVIDVNVNLEDLYKYILESLSESKIVSYDEYYKKTISHKELLKEIKESSYKKLYENSTSCIIHFDNDMIEIIPYQIDVKGGLKPVSSDTVKLPYSQKNQIEIVQAIVKVLEKKYD
jgi:hypothetical protein